jgi:hypothetical protein
MKSLLSALAAFTLALTALYAAPGGDDESIKPINLERLNTEADETDPFITADGLTLYYSSDAPGTFDILVSQRRSANSPWMPGTRLRLNSKSHDARSPFLWRGMLYYATNKIPDEKLKDLKNFDIVQKKGARAPLPLLGISEKEDELHPWITPTGSFFYFSRKTEDGWRLFAARGPQPGPIGGSKLVDLPLDFHSATISADGLTMYLQGPLEKERWGLFRTTRTKAGAAWAKPTPLTALNSTDAPRGDMTPCLSADGSKLFFSSDRAGGKGGLDLWMVPTAQLKKV